MSLYLTYRPNTLEEVKGNQETTSALKGMLKDKDKCPHSFLLHGPTGCGKTTIARIMAQELGCKGSDYKEVDSADFRGIDTIREIRKNSNYKPLEGKYRVWVIDECHQLSKDAQNALLKILEDTPAHVYFILCTTDPQKLLDTIKGRCSQLRVNPLSEKEMFKLLSSVVKREKEKITKSIYDQIVQDSLGLPRNALQILEQVLQVEEDKRLETAKRAAEEKSQSIELCRALMNGSSWKNVKNILNGLKYHEPEQIRRHVLGYCQSVLLNDSNNQAASIIEEFWEPLYNIGFPGLIYCCYSVVKG